MNKKMKYSREKLVLVSCFLFIFSCTPQAPQVNNVPLVQGTSSPVVTVPPSENLSGGTTPNPIPTSDLQSYIRVWDGLKGNHIADSRYLANSSYPYSLAIGKLGKFNSLAYIIKGNTDEKTTYTSLHPEIASVDELGYVTALKEGTARIIISSVLYPSLSLKIDVVVYNPLIPSGIGQTGGTGETGDRVSVSGIIYDFHGNKVDGARVTAKVIQSPRNWIGEDQVTPTYGGYAFRNVPAGAIVEVTASKEGWATETHFILTKTNIEGDPAINKLDFGGPDNQLMGIQDEPLITSIKLNGQLIDFPGFYDNNFDLNNLEQVKDGRRFNNAEKFFFQLEFSEPVDRPSLQNSVRIVSQKFKNSTGGEFTIDISKDLVYRWTADDRSVEVEIPHKLELDKNGSANYLFSFTGEGFKDKSGKVANRGKFIDFTNSPTNDLFIFNVTYMV